MNHILRVVLDTNVLLSGIAYPNSVPGKIMVAWRQGAIEVLLSDYILDELHRVLPKLHHRHGLNESELMELVEILSIQAELLIPTPPHSVAMNVALRDANDQPVLGTLITALHTHHAQYLLTGDKDLLALAEAFPILSPVEFWARHGDF